MHTGKLGQTANKEERTKTMKTRPTLNITQFAPSREGVTSRHKEEDVREMRRWLRDDERGW